VSTSALVARVLTGKGALLAEALGGAGFELSGQCFRRQTVDATQVLEVRASRGPTASSAYVVLDAGAYFPAISELLREPKRKVVREVDGTVRVRFEARRGHAFLVTLAGSPALERAVRTKVLPWFERTARLGRLTFPSRAYGWSDPLGPAAQALAARKPLLAVRRVDLAVSAIERERRRRLSTFGAGDPFGRAVLAAAAKLRARHHLARKTAR
jgi:hypothetical protein